MRTNKEERDSKKMFEIVGSFISGFGKRSNLDINNAIFVAIECQKLGGQ